MPDPADTQHPDPHQWVLIADDDPKETELCIACGAQRDKDGPLAERGQITGGWAVADCSGAQRIAAFDASRPAQHPDPAKRYIVWLCEGCDECDPQDGSERRRGPCENSPSMNGAEVVLAEDYDRLSQHPDPVREAAIEAGAKMGVEWACDEAELAGRSLPRWAELSEHTRLRCREQTRAVLAAAALADPPLGRVERREEAECSGCGATLLACHCVRVEQRGGDEREEIAPGVFVPYAPPDPPLLAFTVDEIDAVAIILGESLEEPRLPDEPEARVVAHISLYRGYAPPRESQINQPGLGFSVCLGSEGWLSDGSR